MAFFTPNFSAPGKVFILDKDYSGTSEVVRDVTLKDFSIDATADSNPSHLIYLDTHALDY